MLPTNTYPYPPPLTSSSPLVGGMVPDSSFQASLALPDTTKFSPIYSSASTPSTSTLLTPRVKGKPGRKRKSDPVDREQLKRDRMVRNRIAAQESREKKRLQTEAVEKENAELKFKNTILENRMSQLENDNALLLSKIEALTQQVGQITGQMNFGQTPSSASSDLGFGESAALTDRGLVSKPRSLQRKPSVLTIKEPSPTQCHSHTSNRSLSQFHHSQLKQIASLSISSMTHLLYNALTSKPMDWSHTSALTTSNNPTTSSTIPQSPSSMPSFR